MILCGFLSLYKYILYTDVVNGHHAELAQRVRG